MAIAINPDWDRALALVRNGSCGDGALKVRACEVIRLLSGSLLTHYPNKVSSHKHGVHFAWQLVGGQCTLILHPRRKIPTVSIQSQGWYPNRARSLQEAFASLTEALLWPPK